MAEHWELLVIYPDEIGYYTPGRPPMIVKLRDFIVRKGGKTGLLPMSEDAIPHILAEGWEPFAVVTAGVTTGVDRKYFRKKIDL
jgi:hypothetical protein